jgi:hypothetical protein
MAMPDIISLLRKDHERVKGLFDQFESANETSRRGAIIEQAIRELEVHSEIEKRLVYPLLEEDQDAVNEALEEHHVAELLIAELKKMKPSENGRIAAKFEVLAENVRHHIKEEESEIFSKLKKADADLDEIGDEAESMKTELTGNALGGNSGMSGMTAGKANPTNSRSQGPRMEDEEGEDEEDDEDSEEEGEGASAKSPDGRAQSRSSSAPARRSNNGSARNSNTGSSGRRAPARSSSPSTSRSSGRSGARSASSDSGSGGGRSPKASGTGSRSSKATATRRKSASR